MTNEQETTAMPTIEELALWLWKFDARVNGTVPQSTWENFDLADHYDPSGLLAEAKDLAALLPRSPVKDAAPAPVLTEEDLSQELANKFDEAERWEWNQVAEFVFDRLTAPQPEENV